MQRRPRAEPKHKVVRNHANYFAGWCLMAMSVGLVFLSDPWMIRVYDLLLPQERLTVLESLGATALLCTIATLGVAFVRIRVEIDRGEFVTVCNPLATWVFHRERIVEFREGTYPRLTLDTGQHVYLMGAEHSLGMGLIGKGLRNDELLSAGTQALSAGSSARVVKSRSGMRWYALPWIAGAVLSVVGLLVASGR